MRNYMIDATRAAAPSAERKSGLNRRGVRNPGCSIASRRLDHRQAATGCRPCAALCADGHHTATGTRLDDAPARGSCSLLVCTVSSPITVAGRGLDLGLQRRGIS